MKVEGVCERFEGRWRVCVRDMREGGGVCEGVEGRWRGV